MSTATLTNHAATVGKLYEAFGRGDIPFILNHIADDCKFVGAGEGVLPQGGTYIGKDAVNFFKKLGDNVEFETFQPRSIKNIDTNEVVAFGYMAGKSKTTGKRSSSDWVMHWKFNDEGKAVYFQDFFNTASAYIANQQ